MVDTIEGKGALTESQNRAFLIWLFRSTLTITKGRDPTPPSSSVLSPHPHP